MINEFAIKPMCSSLLCYANFMINNINKSNYCKFLFDYISYYPCYILIQNGRRTIPTLVLLVKLKTKVANVFHN